MRCRFRGVRLEEVLVPVILVGFVSSNCRKWGTSMNRYLCIHGHFYQPPRENPWLEEIELQDSAFPYHDWNERIMAECYAPNAAARILDGHRQILEITSNY